MARRFWSSRPQYGILETSSVSVKPLRSSAVFDPAAPRPALPVPYLAMNEYGG